MLAVKAVSNYTARTDDQIDVTEGQIFYVLSMTADERKYYLSSSSRVPFSRLAKSGYAPVPLFVVVGDTLPPGVRSKVKMLISDSNAPKSTSTHPKFEKGQKFMGAPRDGTDNDRLGGNPAGAPDQEQRKGLSHNISAAARYWFGGIIGRPSREFGPAVNGAEAAAPTNNDDRPGFDSRQAPLPAASGPFPAPVANVQIVTYAKRRTGVVYRIKFTLADGKEHFVRRTYEDIQKLDGKIRQRFAEMPSLPPPAAVKEEDAAAAIRGKELNIYLQGVVRIHHHLIATGGGIGLDEEICGALASPTGQDPQPVGSKYLPFGFALPAGKRRRPSADSAFSSRPPSRKSSIQADGSQPATVLEDRQHYGVVKAASGKQLAAPAAAAAGPEGLSEDAAAGGFAAVMTRRLERLANLDRTPAQG